MERLSIPSNRLTLVYTRRTWEEIPGEAVKHFIIRPESGRAKVTMRDGATKTINLRRKGVDILADFNRIGFYPRSSDFGKSINN